METLRRVVAPREIDVLGHMNVSAYVDAVSDAMFLLQCTLGLGREDMKRHRLTFVGARIEADYRAELLAGDVIRMDSNVLHIGRKSIRIGHRMTRLTDDVVAFEAVSTNVLFHLDRRVSVTIPDDVRAALERLREEGAA
ncbi:MAG: thioesterase family protein [Pseudomonadota bacterium]